MKIGTEQKQNIPVQQMPNGTLRRKSMKTETELIEIAKSFSEETIEQLSKTDPIYAAILRVAREK